MQHYHVVLFLYVTFTVFKQAQSSSHHYKFKVNVSLFHRGQCYTKNC